jgi:hypothetical protein
MGKFLYDAVMTDALTCIHYNGQTTLNLIQSTVPNMMTYIDQVPGLFNTEIQNEFIKQSKFLAMAVYLAVLKYVKVEPDVEYLLEAAAADYFIVAAYPRPAEMQQTL